MQVILEGIRGEIPIAELRTKYEINQAQYYKWRDLRVMPPVKQALP